MFVNFYYVDFNTNGFTPEFLDLLSFIAILFSIFIIISKNPVVSVLHLIALFMIISFYLASIGLTFIAIAYLLVYVGAVSILFLFILMLINIRISELVSDTNNNIPLALLITILFLYPLNSILPYNSFFNLSFATSKN